MKKYEDIVKSHPVVKELMEICKKHPHAKSIYLTGGAVVDIIDGREPKDYDIIYTCCHGIIQKVSKNDKFRLLYTSRTSITFLFKGKHKVQLLRNKMDEFPFENDKILFRMDGIITGGTIFAKDILDNRLIVVNDDRMNCGISRKLFKARVKKWESKGYNIHPISYKSYLRMTKHKSILRKFVEVFTGSYSETES